MLLPPGEECETTSKLNYIRKEQRDDSTVYASLSSANDSLNTNIEVELDDLSEQLFIYSYDDNKAKEEKETCCFNDVEILCKGHRWGDLSKLFNIGDGIHCSFEIECLLKEVSSAEIIWALIHIQRMKQSSPIVQEILKSDENVLMEGVVFKLRSFIFPSSESPSLVHEKKASQLISLKATVKLLAMLLRVKIEDIMLNSEKAWETFSFLFMPHEKLCDRYAVSSNADEIPLEEIQFLLDNEEVNSDDRYAAIDTNKIGIGIQKYFTACLGIDVINNISLKPPIDVITRNHHHQLSIVSNDDDINYMQETIPLHKDIKDDVSVNDSALERYCVSKGDNIETSESKQLFCCLAPPTLPQDRYLLEQGHHNIISNNQEEDIRYVSDEMNEEEEDNDNDAKIMILSSLSYQESFDNYGDDDTSVEGPKYEFIRTNHHNRGFMIPEEFTLESPYYSDSEAESVYSSDDDDDESDSSSVSTSLYTILFSIVVGSDRS